MIHQNVVLTVLDTPWDEMWSLWKTVRTTLKCIDVLQSRLKVLNSIEIGWTQDLTVQRNHWNLTNKYIIFRNIILWGFYKPNLLYIFATSFFFIAWTAENSLTILRYCINVTHCEILGSYLQQPHQHNVFRAHFKAEPHRQADGNKWQQIFRLI